MLFDTSSAELALDALLAFSYQPPDTTPIFLGGYLSKCPSRKSELNNAVCKLEQTIAAVSKLELKVALLQTRLRNYVAEIKGALTAAAALPTELLCEIFILVADSDESSRARIALSHVSRRWRNIAVAVPELWTVIETGPGRTGKADMLKEFGRRAGSLELHVSSSQTYRDLPADLDLNFSNRCTKLSLLGDVSYGALRSLVPHCYHSNRIREITLEAPRHWLTALPVFEVGEGLPECHTMRLRGVKLPQYGYPLQLKVLHVESMMLQDFRDVICTWHCGSLEALYISHIWPDYNDEEDVIEACSRSIGIRLGQFELKHLEVRDCDTKMLDIIFGGWHKPLPRSVAIDTGMHVCPPFNEEESAFMVSLLLILVSKIDIPI